MTQFDASKDESQDQLVDLFFQKAKGIGTIVASTGYGKTMVGIKAINKFITFKQDNDCIIVVPSEDSHKNWTNEINKYISLTFSHKITILTIHSIIRNKLKLNTKLIVIDEIHNLTTDDRLGILQGKLINYKYILGLTATPPNPKTKLYDVLKTTCPIIHTITDFEAVSKGWISEFTEYNIGIDLSESDRELHDEYTEFMKDKLQKYDLSRNQVEMLPYVINHNNINAKSFSGEVINAMLYGNPKYGIRPDWYRLKVAEFRGWSKDMDLTLDYYKNISEAYAPNVIFNDVTAYSNIMNKRTKLLYSNPAKDRVVIDILKHMEGYNFISTRFNTINS